MKTRYLEMYELRKSGWSYEKIGLKYKRTHQSVQWILKKFFPIIKHHSKKITGKCLFCGKIYSKYKYSTKEQRKYCSQKCAHSSIIPRSLRNKKHPNYDLDKIRNENRERQVKYYQTKNGHKNIVKSLLKSKDKLKDFARIELNKAIKRGEIKKPKKCSICRKSKVSRIEGHHSNYNKPLEVIWVCPPCHYKIDKR